MAGNRVFGRNAWRFLKPSRPSKKRSPSRQRNRVSITILDSRPIFGKETRFLTSTKKGDRLFYLTLLTVAIDPEFPELSQQQPVDLALQRTWLLVVNLQLPPTDRRFDSEPLPVERMPQRVRSSC